MCVAVNIVTSLYNLKEEELITKQKDLQRQLHEVSSIITDGSERLQVAIKKKDSLGTDRATILIDVGNMKSKMISEQLSEVNGELIKILIIIIILSVSDSNNHEKRHCLYYINQK